MESVVSRDIRHINQLIVMCGAIVGIHLNEMVGAGDIPFYVIAHHVDSGAGVKHNPLG